MTQNENPQPKGTLTVMHGSGTNDPFTARMLFGLCQIRDHFYKDNERLKFDSLFIPVYQNLSEARYVKDQCIETLKNHKENIETGKLSKYENNMIKVEEDITFPLNLYFKDFFIRGHMALDCLKRLTDQIFDTNIEFFFSNGKNFKKGLGKFKLEHNSNLSQHFVKMLIAERENWFGTFVDMRIKIEHKGFTLKNLKYELKDNIITPVFPKIYGRDIPELLEILWGNLFGFCEDTIIMLFASNLKDPFSLVTIPEEQRDPDMPLKYKLTIIPPPELLKQIIP